MSRSLAFSSPNPFVSSSRSPRDLEEPLLFCEDHELLIDWHHFQRSAGSTAIQKMQLRKEHDSPFHEFVMVFTQASYVYRVDRSREGPVLDTLRKQGVPPVDTIAMVRLPSLKQLDGTSYCAIELCWGSDKTLDLKFVLDVCFQIHNNSGKRYKLLTHNCYFFAQTIITVTARKTVTCKLDGVLNDMSKSNMLLDVTRSAATAVITRMVLELLQLYLGQQRNLHMNQRKLGSWWQRLLKPGREWEQELELELELARELVLAERERELALALEKELEAVWEMELERELVMEMELEPQEQEQERVREWEWVQERERERDMDRLREWGKQSRELALERVRARVRECVRERAWRGMPWGGTVRQLREELGLELEKQLELSLGEQLGDQLGGQLGKRVGEQLGKQLGKHLAEELESPFVLRLILLPLYRERIQILYKLELLLSCEALIEVLQLALIGELELRWHIKCSEVMVAAYEGEHNSGHGGRWAKWLVRNLGRIVIHEVQQEPLLGCSFSWLLKFPASFSASSKINAKAPDVEIKNFKDLEDYMNGIVAQHVESVPPALGSREELKAEILSGMTATWHLVSPQFQQGGSRAVESVLPALGSTRTEDLRTEILSRLT